MKTLILGLIVAGAITAGLTSAALASNDPRVPGDNCSGNPVAVGQPGNGDLAGGAQADVPFDGIANAVDIGPSPVAAPASLNNPGESTGALGQENFDGGTRC